MLWRSWNQAIQWFSRARQSLWYMLVQNEEKHPSLLQEDFTQVEHHQRLSHSLVALNQNHFRVQCLGSKCLLSWVSFRITFLWNVILKASQSYQCLCVVLTSDSSMSKHPAIVTGALFYPHGSEAPAQQERCGNVGKPLYYFKSRLL